MIQKYTRLFQLDIFHTYFQKDICRCLAFKAESSTAQLMERFRLVMRRQVNGIGFYGSTKQSLPQLLDYIEQATGQDAFCFEIMSNDPYFNFITELPSNWVGQLLYNSNDVSVLANNVHLNEQLSTVESTACVGKVTLYFADILKYSEQTGFANFDIRYEARATQWQYFVINRSSIPINDPVISGKQPITFTGPENVMTTAGEAALLFSSSSLIPLSEEPLPKFNLINRQTSIDQQSIPSQVIIKGLPTPYPEWIGNANGQPSSPMYVYL